MNPVLSGTARHGALLPPGQRAAAEAWPGDEREFDWGLGLASDLGPGGRAALVALVVLAHGLVAALVLRERVTPRLVPEPLVITAQLLSGRAQPVPASTARSEDAPVNKQEAEPRTPPPPSRQTPIAPAPPVPRTQAPVTTPPPVLASPNAQAVPTQPMPALAPPADSKAVSPAQTPTAPVPQVPTPSTTTAPLQPGAAATPALSAESPRSAAPPKDLPMSAVRYLAEPPKLYPRASREMGETGTVLLRVLVDEEGRPKTVLVTKSSGFPRLDRQAVQNMSAARFQPHVEGGAPRAVWVPAEIIFNLD